MNPEIPPSPIAGATAGQSISLECRLAAGPWQPCTMTVLQLGEHWWLQVGHQRLEFRSDGRGSVSLRSGTDVPRAVRPVWSADQALCWDGVCAKGNLPLD